MALSNDCLRQHDRENTLTQRRLTVGLLGAVGLHMGLLPWLNWSPLQLTQLDEPDRIQLVVTPEAPEPIPETLSEEVVAPPEPEAPPPVPAELAETPTAALTLDDSPEIEELETETAPEPEAEVSEAEPEVETSASEEISADPLADVLSRLLTGVGNDLDLESVPEGDGTDDETDPSR
ncbi:MAG: hypothetical protein F6K42_35475 [Leptolyngbya sp. SIO1D8]|nr:hypothetical protein [Leptolyngbya sp. SIO1D8]